MNKAFFSVWIKNGRTFISIFISPKFMKLMIDNKRPDTYKIVLFCGI